MPDLEKVIKGLEETEIMLTQAVDRGGEMAVMGAFKCLNRVTDAIDLLKEQEPKTGKWIPIKSTTGVEAFGVKEMTVMDVRCSVCGSEEDVSFTGYKYCPRCGAKMTGGEA